VPRPEQKGLWTEVVQDGNSTNVGVFHNGFRIHTLYAGSEEEFLDGLAADIDEAREQREKRAAAAEADREYY